MNKVPKIIHYCWFGENQKSKLINKCIASWDIMNGYEIIEWNETNFDISSHNFIKEAYSQKKYAFVADYVRLKVLYEYGGIYLDTDLEIFKELPQDFLKHKVSLCFMFDCNISTAIIACEPKNNMILELLNKYDDLLLNNNPNNDLFTTYLIEKYETFRLNNKFQILNDDIVIYPKEYFECPSFNKKLGFSMHHLDNSWIDSNDLNRYVKKIIKKIIGIKIYHKYIRKKSLKNSPFYEIYIKHR